jgi:hypothetical protein
MLLTNLLAYDGDVWLVTVTAPGYDVLPAGDQAAMDEWNRTASRRWSELHRRAQQACRRSGVSPVLLAYAWQLQGRGALHLHLVLGFASDLERGAAWSYVGELRSRTREFGFGFVDAVDKDGKSGRSRVMERHRAAGYLSRYLGESAQFMRALSLVHRPARLVWVSPRLTTVTGCIRRRLRRVRFLWHIRNGTSIFAHAGRLPRWFSDAAELAAVSALAAGSLPAMPAP